MKKTVPYDFRTGRITGKYVLSRMMSQKEKEKRLNNYRQHLQKELTVRGCSLKEYLGTAALCYRKAFRKGAAKLTPRQRHDKWAATGDGGMLSIKDPDSRRAFSRWYNRSGWTGAHPFEIVFSWHDHGIHLYPPASHNAWQYCLKVSNYDYAGVFADMADTLIADQVPFTAHDFENVLDFLAGETYFTVNEYSDNSFFYVPSREYKTRYFKHIEWDELKII